jgi:hypothetical protein
VEYNDLFPNGGTWQPLADVTNRTGETASCVDAGGDPRQVRPFPASRFYRARPL